MDGLTPEMQRLLAAKENRRQRLARASFPEKIAALIRLQTMAAPIQRQRGRMVKPWRVAVSTEALTLNESPGRYEPKKPTD